MLVLVLSVDHLLLVSLSGEGNFASLAKHGSFMYILAGRDLYGLGSCKFVALESTI